MKFQIEIPDKLAKNLNKYWGAETFPEKNLEANIKEQMYIQCLAQINKLGAKDAETN
jgi:hypothetical protein